MKNLHLVGDKFAISLSLLCAIHCLVLPISLALLPSITALQLDNDSFHSWLLFAVLPTSIYALTMGCKKHKQYRLFAIAILGLACLVLAVIFETFISDHSLYSSALEKTLTTIGTIIICYVHYQNFQLCRHQENCDCHEHHNV